MSIKTQSFFVRFAKGFVAGGVGAMALQLQAGIHLASLIDLKMLGLTLTSAFITGGLLAIEKMLTWQETLQ